jgi:hypothetical protein
MKRLVALVVLVLATAAAAQDLDWFRRGYGRFRRVPPRLATADSFDGAFNFCRVMYTSVRRHPSGQGWWTDYPDADINFSIRLGEVTKTRISRDLEGNPNHLVVPLTDENLFKCPWAILEDAGSAGLTDEEITALRTYLLKGGFLWVDDFWGPWAWDNWITELSRVLPPSEYPIRDLPMDHPIFKTMFEVKELPQIPSINFWSRSGGATSELGSDSETPTMRAITDQQGNIMVLITHNTDIADAWEREGEDPRYFYSFSPDGYAVGINVLMYAFTH